MAAAKKAKKRNFKKVNISTQVAPLIPGSVEGFNQHLDKVDTFAKKVIDIVEKDDVNSIVAIDAFQLLLIAGVKSVMGDNAAEILKENLAEFQKQAAVISVLEMLSRGRTTKEDRPLEERSMLDILGPLATDEQ